MNYLITGGCGFLGSNLAVDCLRRGHTVTVMDNLSRLGSSANLQWIRSQGACRFVHGDVRNQYEVESVVVSAEPDVIFHLAGQVAMTTSLASPILDFQTNVAGTLYVLEAMRKHAPKCAFIYSSTNKVYGDLEQFHYLESHTRYDCVEHPDGFNEDVGLEFHSPYGCSKGAADQYVLDYHRMYGLKTLVFRHSSMYGGRQFSTTDQGWIGWFCQKAIDQASGTDSEPFSISGNGKQVRDVLHVKDMLQLYDAAVCSIDNAAGHAFNIGGGIKNSLSLLELFTVLNEQLGIQLRFFKIDARKSDQRFFVADISKAQAMLNWTPQVDTVNGVASMLKWIKELNDD
ncbi:GDP-mannose 4,6-dehydratase [Variovorax sp. PCZ-1]|uniref:GDP-mannose 4,6-dehydratase n=1 Tax=Variovorax sp. PCZ-1 TaxID=2835533 RepID=UPI001BCED953|nr:GDP-mannose 4,6-dehydratase [Variovorax sp. PCZ-1]MBS7808571.1 GDP-mannose 4,6-dehydratase [Variovorax sp. PCZ-1]